MSTKKSNTKPTKGTKTTKAKRDPDRERLTSAQLVRLTPGQADRWLKAFQADPREITYSAWMREVMDRHCNRVLGL